MQASLAGKPSRRLRGAKVTGLLVAVLFVLLAVALRPGVVGASHRMMRPLRSTGRKLAKAKNHGRYRRLTPNVPFALPLSYRDPHTQRRYMSRPTARYWQTPTAPARSPNYYKYRRSGYPYPYPHKPEQYYARSRENAGVPPPPPMAPQISRPYGLPSRQTHGLSMPQMPPSLVRMPHPLAEHQQTHREDEHFHLDDSRPHSPSHEYPPSNRPDLGLSHDQILVDSYVSSDEDNSEPWSRVPRRIQAGDLPSR